MSDEKKERENIVIFKFKPGAIVVNPLGGRALVDLAGVDDGGIKYGVKNANGEYAWWGEYQLNKFEA